VLIAGTYTPIALNVLAASWRVGILGAVWCLALAGVVIAAVALPLPRAVMVSLYIVTGWVALAAIPQIAAATGPGGLLLLVLGGLHYTAGALAYALKKPALWPRVFGYHELFHLATLAANAAFFVFLIAYVLPVARR